jgi:hypothetical protein
MALEPVAGSCLTLLARDRDDRSSLNVDRFMPGPLPGPASGIRWRSERGARRKEDGSVPAVPSGSDLGRSSAESEIALPETTYPTKADAISPARLSPVTEAKRSRSRQK